MARPSPDLLTITLDYHERTKHHPHRYAAGPGYLDWASQPDPFRRFAGAPLLPLDRVEHGTESAIAERDATTILDRAAISQLFFDSLALSAWKEAGASRWSLRVNPSSGNLHPTEGYLLAGAIPGFSDIPALYHYAPHEHALERRRTIASDAWNNLSARLPAECILIGLSSIYWREAWKYGERAFRYCQHDAGHAIAAVAIAAAHLGWHTRMVVNVPDAELSRLLGIADQEGIEAEHADCLLAISAGRSAAAGVPLDVLSGLCDGSLTGTPNTLSSAHRLWPVIDEVSLATQRHEAVEMAHPHPGLPDPPAHPHWSRRIIRTRRSALALDGVTPMPRDRFHEIVQRLNPRTNPVPFAALPWPPAIHLVFFVHRVTGLAPGLYLQVRNPADEPDLRAHLRREFVWQRPSDAPKDFHLLAETDSREAAQIVSCHQEIAADGAFACAMLARFEPELRARGPWFYKCLHWEAGAVGQVLYLEAEAAGLRGTGIGCFFDDLIHRLLGLEREQGTFDRTFQSLYNFTIGGPVEDPRLRTIAPYAHLE